RSAQSMNRLGEDPSEAPFVDFFFVHFLKSGPLQIPIGVFDHIKGFGHQHRTTDLFGPFYSLRNQGLLGSAFAMTLGSRRCHQVSKIFEDAKGGNSYRTPAIKCHVMEEALLA